MVMGGSGRSTRFLVTLLLATLIVGSSTQLAQSLLPGVHFATVYEMSWSAVDSSTDDEIWVSIHYTDGSITNTQVTDTSGYESDPSIAIAPNGNIIVVWEIIPDSVYFAVLNRAGQIIKGPTVLSSVAEDSDPCVAVTPNGVVFVVWEYTPPDPDQVAYVTMDANGGNITPAKYISGVKGDIDDPTVAASTKNAEDNRVVIAWEDADGVEDHVAFTILDSSGTTLVSKRTITAAITEYQEEINAAILPNGNVVIVCEAGGPSTGEDVGYAIVDRSGALVVPVTFIDRPQDIDEPGVAVTPGGNIVIVWTEEVGAAAPVDDVMYTVLSSAGDTIKPVTKLTDSAKSEDEPDVIVDNNGKVVIIYEQELSPDDRVDFAILDSNGNKQGTDKLTDGTYDADLEGEDGSRQVATEAKFSRPVAGVVVPVNKLAVLAPYLALAGLVAVVSAIIVARRKKA